MTIPYDGWTRMNEEQNKNKNRILMSPLFSDTKNYTVFIMIINVVIKSYGTGQFHFLFIQFFHADEIVRCTAMISVTRLSPYWNRVRLLLLKSVRRLFYRSEMRSAKTKTKTGHKWRDINSSTSSQQWSTTLGMPTSFFTHKTGNATRKHTAEI